MSIIERNIDAIKRLCAVYEVAQMSVFGSVLTDRFNDDSDIDILMLYRWRTMPKTTYSYRNHRRIF